MNELKLVKTKRKISLKTKPKGGEVLLIDGILRGEVTLAPNGATGIRIPLPKKYQDRLNWKSGDDVFITLTDDNKVIIEGQKPSEKAKAS